MHCGVEVALLALGTDTNCTAGGERLAWEDGWGVESEMWYWVKCTGNGQGRDARDYLKGEVGVEEGSDNNKSSYSFTTVRCCRHSQQGL